MKYGPTSAATSARINAKAKPSRVVCTNVLRARLHGAPSGPIPGPPPPWAGRLDRTPPKAAIICRFRRSRSKCDDFSGIHEVVRVKRALERAHDIERRTVLGGEVLHLAL